MYIRLTASPVVIRKDTVLIVKLDGIGDYLLARNGIRALRKSAAFSQQHFTLLGNIAWKELAEKFDDDCFQEFIWIDPKIVANFKNYDAERIVLLQQMRLKGFETIIHPVHSRVTGIDRLIADSGATRSITSSGDAINAPEMEKEYSDRLYTQLVPVPNPSTFEYIRNDCFFSKLMNMEVGCIRLELSTQTSERDQKRIVIAPGAGHAFRRWPARNFGKLIQELQQNDRTLKFDICGSKADSVLANEIISVTNDCLIQNHCGKLTLDEFASHVASSILLIGNDSGSIHLAAATDTPAVCISNGNTFGRFHPYPDWMKKSILTLYPDPAFEDPLRREEMIIQTRYRSSFSTEAVGVEAVLNACLKLLGS